MHGAGGSAAALLGTVCGFAAAYAFISETGWSNGIVWWAGSGLAFAALGFMGNRMFPGLLMLGAISGTVGLALLCV